MKRLLSLAILVVGLVVISYAVSHHKKAPAPAPVIVQQTPAEVIEQEHSAALPEPKAPEAPYVITPTDPKLAPVVVVPTPQAKPVVKPKKKPHPRPQQFVLPPPPPPAAVHHCLCKAL